MSKLYELAVRAKGRFRKLDVATRLTRNHNYSIIFLFVQKIRILIVFILFTSLSLRSLRRTRKISRTQRDIARGRDALIIAGGPSSLKLNLHKVKADQMSNKVSVFAMNWYTHTELAHQLVPDYYVLSDPLNQMNRHSEFRGRRSVDIWSQLAKWTETKLILPHNWYPYTKDFETRISMFIDNRELIGFSKSTNPTKPRGYGSLTALNAVAAAQYMGFDNVFLIGLDGNMFYALTVDGSGQIFLGGSNLADSELTPLVGLSPDSPSGMADVLYNFSTEFLDIRRCFTAPNIFNLNLDSLVDGIKKIDNHPFLKHCQVL